MEGKRILARSMLSKAPRHWKEVLLYACALISLSFFLLPVVWILGTALKSSLEYLSFPPRLIPVNPTLENFYTAFKSFYAWDYLRNSIIVSLSSTFLACLIGCPAAYALARCRVRGRRQIAFFILAMRMFPPVAVAIPFFIIFKALNLLDNYLGLVIAYQIFLLPFVIWMVRGFFEEIPIELEESAMVDGCTHFGALAKVVLPLAAPGMVATAIFATMMAWNEFLFGVVLTNSKAAQPITVLVGSFIAPERGSMWGEMSVVGLVSMVPLFIFALVLQRHLIRGLTMGAVKG